MKTSNPFKLALVLFIITALTTLALASVNAMTAPIIAANTEKKVVEAQQIVLDADEFRDSNVKDFSPSAEGVEVTGVKLGYSGEEFAGYVVTSVCGEGYGGDIEVMVGIDTDKKVTKIEIMSLSETPGLGANAQKDTFKAQYGGKSSGIAVKKGGGASGNEIDAISGATITSKAVTKAVNAALEAVDEMEAGN